MCHILWMRTYLFGYPWNCGLHLNCFCTRSKARVWFKDVFWLRYAITLFLHRRCNIKLYIFTSKLVLHANHQKCTCLSLYKGIQSSYKNKLRQCWWNDFIARNKTPQDFETRSHIANYFFSRKNLIANHFKIGNKFLSSYNV